jgi:hypothetical protein
VAAVRQAVVAVEAAVAAGKAGGLDFFILPLFYSFAFPAFAMTALLFARRDSAAHKRRVFVASTNIVRAAYPRGWVHL